MNASTLMWGVIFESIGLGFFVYGKKQKAIIPFLRTFNLGSDQVKCLEICKKSSKNGGFFVLNVPFWVQNSGSKDYL